MRATGRHPHKALTARTVSTTTEPGRYADGGGLYLLVAPGGSKSWMLRTVVQGRRCDIGLGSVELVSLADGREKARRLRRIARVGGDPLAERRQERRPVPSFEDAAKAVHTAHAASFKSDKHSKQWLSSLAEVFKAFGAKRVDAITSADILAALNPALADAPRDLTARPPARPRRLRVV